MDGNQQLTNLTGLISPDFLDLFYIVDVSDTTDGPSGTSKKISLNTLKGLWESGSVLSVAGKTGSVTLGVADIGGLQSNLNNLQSSGLTIQSLVTGLQSTTSGLATATGILESSIVSLSGIVSDIPIYSPNWILKTGNYTGINGNKILADTTSGSFTVVTPTAPSVGNTISFADSKYTWSTNNLIISGNGFNIETGTTLICNTGVLVDLVFNGTKWRLI